MKILLGLKGSSNLAQIDDRLQHHPDVYEFYTDANDFTPDGYQHLYEAVQYVQNHGVKKIVLHHPMKFGQTHAEIVAPEKQFPKLYRFIEDTTMQLTRLAKDLDVQCLIHGAYAQETTEYIDCYPDLQTAQQAAFDRLDRFAKAGGEHIMFENSIAPVFSYGDPVMEDEILMHHYRLAFDTSHCFIWLHGDNLGLQGSLSHLKDQIVHYHLVDSMGQTHDSLTLGTGKIDWREVLPRLNPNATSIYEINLKDQGNCQEQLQSHAYLTELAQKLD